ncbi:MAG TPA: hypothetical protein PKV67_00570 [Hyphomonas sp.]|nr:hypothetical protein [Hyphomonas sp.]HRI99240.1 hypothetical protein [Hyphomonas sp.]HRK66660.1 hypothetical protein [Hyphomonas sp.]
MKQLNRLIFSASAGLAAALMMALPGAALTQDADAVEVSEPEEDAADEVSCEDESDCNDVDPEYAEDEAGLAAPPAGTTADDASPQGGASASEPVLITPGSTDESNPGGSTRPGTTPDT